MGQVDQVDALLAGEPLAWSAFVEALGPSALGAVRASLQRYRGQAGLGGLDAEDLVQEVFVRLAKHDFRLLRSYDPTRASLGTFVRLVAHSVTLDALRRRSLTQEHEPMEGHEAAWSQDPAQPESHTRIAQVLGEAPPTLLTASQHQVLTYLFDLDLDVEEAAQRLKVSPQTVRSLKHKALSRLRDFFGAELPASKEPKT